MRGSAGSAAGVAPTLRALAFLLAQNLLSVLECMLPLRRKILSATILVEAEHLHRLPRSLRRDGLLRQSFGNLLRRLPEQPRTWFRRIRLYLRRPPPRRGRYRTLAGLGWIGPLRCRARRGPGCSPLRRLRPRRACASVCHGLASITECDAGQAVLASARRRRKKSDSIAPHSSASTPSTTSTRWFSAG